MAGAVWCVAGWAAGVLSMCWLAHLFHTAPLVPSDEED